MFVWVLDFMYISFVRFSGISYWSYTDLIYNYISCGSCLHRLVCLVIPWHVMYVNWFLVINIIFPYSFSWSCKFMGYLIALSAEKGRKLIWLYKIITEYILLELQLLWMEMLAIQAPVFSAAILQRFSADLEKLVPWDWQDYRILEILASWIVPFSA